MKIAKRICLKDLFNQLALGTNGISAINVPATNANQKTEKMNNHNTMQQSLPDLKFDKKRRRVKQCPCGKSNKDGKFIAYIGYDDKGFCHACGETFLPALNVETECFFVPFVKIVDYSKNAYQLITKDGIFFLPKSVVYEILPAGAYVSSVFLNDGGSNKKPKFFANDCKMVSNCELLNKPTQTCKLEKQPSFISLDIFKDSLKDYESNNFVHYLIELFGSVITKGLIEKYYIGTSDYWEGASTFWQIDNAGKIRAGKIMHYSPITGKRIKEPFSHIQWVHCVLKLPNYNLQQGFFGAHLLKDNNKPCAIVESEKTAIIASVYLPKIIWLAAGNKQGLSADKCNELAGRNVTLYPDSNAFDEWNEKAKEYGFKISDLLEKKATKEEKQQGLDIADYLTRFNYKEFIEPKAIELSSSSVSLMTETHTTKEFNHIIIVGVKDDGGTWYDLFINRDGELIKQGEQAEAVQQLAKYFKKNLVPILFDNVPTFAHKHN